MTDIATVPVYITWVAGTIVTAAQLNANITTNGNFWLARPYVDVDLSTNPSLVAGTALLLSWDTENEDNDNMHSLATNTSRIIFNTLGLYELHWYSRVSATGSGIGTLNARLNAAGSSGGGTSLSTTQYDLSASRTTQMERFLRYRAVNSGDYYELFSTSSITNALSSGGNRVNGTTALWQIQ